MLCEQEYIFWEMKLGSVETLAKTEKRLLPIRIRRQTNLYLNLL